MRVIEVDLCKNVEEEQRRLGRDEEGEKPSNIECNNQDEKWKMHG